MAYDPWDWANQTQQTTPLAAPLSNIVTPMPASNEQGDPGQVISLPPTQAEKDMQQMRSMAVNKGTEKGGEYAYGKYKAMQAGPIGTGGAPVVEQSVMASTPTIAAPAGTMAGMGTGVAAEAATTAATQAATAAPLSATVGAAAPAAAGAAEAGMLAAVPGIGWGVGALLLAKSMNWI